MGVSLGSTLTFASRLSWEAGAFSYQAEPAASVPETHRLPGGGEGGKGGGERAAGGAAASRTGTPPQTPLTDEPLPLLRPHWSSGFWQRAGQFRRGLAWQETQLWPHLACSWQQPSVLVSGSGNAAAVPLITLLSGFLVISDWCQWVGFIVGQIWVWVLALGKSIPFLWACFLLYRMGLPIAPTSYILPYRCLLLLLVS